MSTPQPKIAIGTSIGRQKEYCFPILAKTLPVLSENWQEDTIIVFDGISHTGIKYPVHNVIKTNYPKEWTRYQRIAALREETRKLFISEKFKDYTHLLWLDADIVPPIDGLAKLLENSKDIVTGVYQCRSTGDAVIPMYDIKDATSHWANSATFSETERLYKCNGFGMGFMLISRKALDKVPFRDANYFKDLRIGEDWKWCLDAEEQGFEIFVDTNVCCWHSEKTLASRITIEEMREGAVWKGPGWQVQNQHGVFNINTPRTNLNKAAIEELRNSPEIHIVNTRNLKMEKTDLVSLLASL